MNTTLASDVASSVLFGMLFLIAGFAVGMAFTPILLEWQNAEYAASTMNDSRQWVASERAAYMAECDDHVQSMRMFSMQQYNFSNVQPVDGLAFGDYFAVWTKNRTVSDVLETCAHEYAHNNLGMND